MVETVGERMADRGETSMTLTETIEWVPVSERLPDNVRSVLIMDRHEYCDRGWFHRGKHQWIGPTADPIYWAELPKGPTP